MTEELRKDEELVREAMAMLRRLEDKTQSLRTDGEIKQDAECSREAKKRMGEQKRKSKTKTTRGGRGALNAQYFGEDE